MSKHEKAKQLKSSNDSINWKIYQEQIHARSRSSEWRKEKKNKNHEKNLNLSGSGVNSLSNSFQNCQPNYYNNDSELMLKQLDDVKKKIQNEDSEILEQNLESDLVNNDEKYKNVVVKKILI